MQGVQPPECACGHLRPGSQQKEAFSFTLTAAVRWLLWVLSEEPGWEVSVSATHALGLPTRRGEEHLAGSCTTLSSADFSTQSHVPPLSASHFCSARGSSLSLQFTSLFLPLPRGFAWGASFPGPAWSPGDIPGGSSAMAYPESEGVFSPCPPPRLMDRPVTCSLVWPRAHGTEQLAVHQRGERVLISASAPSHVTRAALSSTHISILLWFCGQPQIKSRLPGS